MVTIPCGGCGRMSDNNLKNRKSVRVSKSVYRALATLFLVIGILVISFISLKIYLSTPQAASRVSRLLTSALHQPVLVSRLELDGGTLRARQVSLGNPTRFPGSLAMVDVISIQPQWSDLLRGRQSFRLLALEGLRLHLRKDSAGVWNFEELQRFLGSRKPSDKELFLRQLMVKSGTIQVHDQVVRDINLQLFNLSSKGKRDADIELVFEDAANHRYTIAGRARGGSEPALDLTLSVPSFSVNGAAGMLGLKKQPLYGEEPGALKVSAVMQGELIQSSLRYEFKGMRVTAGSPQLSGAMNATAVYDSSRDEARLETMTLFVNDLVKLHASGRVSDLRAERKFSAELSAEEIDLARIAFLLPQAEQRRTVLAGRIGSTSMKVSGDAARGIATASGIISLHDGAVTRNGRNFINGLKGTIRLAAAGKAISLAGRLQSGGRSGETVLQDLDTSFSMSLSSSLKPLAAKVSPLSARAMGFPFRGSLTFSKGAAEPYKVALQIPSSSLQSLGPFLKPYDLHPASGTASISLHASGQGVRDLHGAGRMEILALQGRQGEKPFSLKRGGTDVHFAFAKDWLELSGDAQITGAAFAGKGGEGAFSYHLANDRLTLSKSTFQGEGVSGFIERVTATVPRRTSGQVSRYPVALELTGGRIRRDLIQLNGISGSLDALYIAAAGEKWLEGKAYLGVAEIARGGKSLAAPAARIIFACPGVRAEISGTALGGQLSGTMALNPFALGEKATFKTAITQLQLAKASTLAPAGWKTLPSGGLVDITCVGSYSKDPGLDARMAVKAKGLSITNSTGKTIFSNGGINLNGALLGEQITVDTAVVSAGEDVAFTIKGVMERVFSSNRKGHFFVALPVTPVNSMIDPVVNIMPRLVQEAILDGTIAGEGSLDLQNDKMLLQGAVRLKDVAVKLDDQRLQVADLNGVIPVSLDFTGNNVGRTFDTLSFTRENYPRLLEQYRRQAGEASSVTIGRLVLGPLDLGSVGLQMSAGNGVTRIDRLKASLYGGNVFGKAAFSIDRGPYSRADLLLDGISLRQLCDVFPKITGYISGLLDGVISIDATGREMAGLSGFTELWAREGKREKKLISKEFLQKLSGKKLSGFFFRNDRPYDNAEINAILEYGYLTFELLDITNTNFFGVTDLSVSIAPTQNRIALAHLFDTIQQAAVRGTRSTAGEPSAGEQKQEGAPSEQGFQWQD